MQLANNQIVVLTSSITFYEATNFSLNNESFTIKELVNLVNKLEAVELLKKLNKLCDRASIIYCELYLTKQSVNCEDVVLLQPNLFSIQFRNDGFEKGNDVATRENQLSEFKKSIDNFNDNLEANIAFLKEFNPLPVIKIPSRTNYSYSIDALINSVLSY